MKREPGYYWVKRDSVWDIGHCLWTGTKHYWYLWGGSTQYPDDFFEEINETKLIHPDKKQG